jgi:hypothetical protein
MDAVLPAIREAITEIVHLNLSDVQP